LGFSQTSATVRLVCAGWKAVHDALVRRLVLRRETTDEAMGMLVRSFPAVVSLEVKWVRSGVDGRGAASSEQPACLPDHEGGCCKWAASGGHCKAHGGGRRCQQECQGSRSSSRQCVLQAMSPARAARRCVGRCTATAWRGPSHGWDRGVSECNTGGGWRVRGHPQAMPP
jgi:hypothetical protein